MNKEHDCDDPDGRKEASGTKIYFSVNLSTTNLTYSLASSWRMITD